MGFWSGLQLICPCGGSEHKNAIQAVDMIKDSDFYSRCIHTRHLGEWVADGHYPLGSVEGELCRFICREPCAENSVPFAPTDLGVLAGELRLCHLGEEQIVDGVRISISGQGYPYPWGIDDVIPRFRQLPGYFAMLSDVSATIPCVTRLSLTDFIEELHPFLSFPNEFNGWFWHLYGDG